MRNALLVCLFALITLTGFSQEVIMNQPSADIVAKGKVFVRADEFYTQRPAFYQENLNLVYGLFNNFEISLNATNAFNRVPMPAVFVLGFKYAPYKSKHLTIFVGDQYAQTVTHKTLAGYTHGNMTYEAAAVTVGNWRFTGGSFQSHNAVALGNRAGALGGIEWTAYKFKNGWSVIPGVDYASGAGINGYTSPGLGFAKGNFFICPGYMIGNPHNPNGAHQSFVMMGYTF